MNNPHLLLTRVPLEYCRFRSEYIFFRFDSRLKREAYSLVMVSTMYLKITELHYQNINKNMLCMRICFLSSLNIRMKEHCTTKDYSESFLTPSSQKDDISRETNNERWCPSGNDTGILKKKELGVQQFGVGATTVRLVLQMLLHWVVGDSWQIV